MSGNTLTKWDLKFLLQNLQNSKHKPVYGRIIDIGRSDAYHNRKRHFIGREGLFIRSFYWPEDAGRRDSGLFICDDAPDFPLRGTTFFADVRIVEVF